MAGERMHFAQAAFALIAAGAAILTIAAFVRESLHDNGRHLHLFPEAHDRARAAAAKSPEPPAMEPVRLTQSHDENALQGGRGRSGSDDNRERRRQGGKKKRRSKKRYHSRQGTEAARRTTAEIVGT